MQRDPKLFLADMLEKFHPILSLKEEVVRIYSQKNVDE